MIYVENPKLGKNHIVVERFHNSKDAYKLTGSFSFTQTLKPLSLSQEHSTLVCEL